MSCCGRSSSTRSSGASWSSGAWGQTKWQVRNGPYKVSFASQRDAQKHVERFGGTITAVDGRGRPLKERNSAASGPSASET